MIAQGFILIFSAAGLWLLSCRNTGRAGWIVSLCAQPFWLFETFHAAQWGMFANSIAFTIIYLRGLINHWHPDH